MDASDHRTFHIYTFVFFFSFFLSNTQCMKASDQRTFQIYKYSLVPYVSHIYIYLSAFLPDVIHRQTGRHISHTTHTHKTCPALPPSRMHLMSVLLCVLLCYRRHKFNKKHINLILRFRLRHRTDDTAEVPYRFRQLHQFAVSNPSPQAESKSQLERFRSSSRKRNRSRSP